MKRKFIVEKGETTTTVYCVDTEKELTVSNDRVIGEVGDVYLFIAGTPESEQKQNDKALFNMVFRGVKQKDGTYHNAFRTNITFNG
jgi:hypothetical protein